MFVKQACAVLALFQLITIGSTQLNPLITPQQVRDRVQQLFDVPGQIRQNLTEALQRGIQDGVNFIVVAGRRIACFPGICLLAEIRNHDCQRIVSCDPGYTIQKSFCGCCKKCVSTNSDSTSPEEQ